MKVSVESGKAKVVLTKEEAKEAIERYVNEVRGFDLEGMKVEYIIDTVIDHA